MERQPVKRVGVPCSYLRSRLIILITRFIISVRQQLFRDSHGIERQLLALESSDHVTAHRYVIAIANRLSLTIRDSVPDSILPKPPKISSSIRPTRQ